MKRTMRFINHVVADGIVLLMTAAAFVPAVKGQDYDPEQVKRGVARISILNGDVSVRRGDGDVVAAAPNAPLVTEDRIYTGPASRAEVQFDPSNYLRVASDSEVRMAQLEANRFYLQLARGTVQFAVLRDGAQGSDIEIDTPSVSVRPVVSGEYRISVLEDGSTEVTVRAGQAEILTPRGSQRLDPGRTMLVRGSQSDPEFQLISELRPDEFDQWSQSRDREIEARAAEAYRYVPRDVPGAEDLSGNGQWVYEQPYGYVWAPTVADTWAPYRYGRWSWVDWYGWSWVSADPWGWAPYHYGRWFHGGHGWCWYPGPAGPHHYWNPALVAFVGFGGGGVGVGFGFGGGWGNIGWIPLAPYEVYHPWWGYGYGHGGHNFNQVNIVNNINIVNNYRNARVVNGITGVDAHNFGRVGSTNFVRVSGDQIRGASVVRGALPVAPGRESLRVVDRDPSRTVRTNDNVRSFYSPRQTTNAVSRVPFEQQRQNMQEISRQTFGTSAVQGRSSSDFRAPQSRGTEIAPAGRSAESTSGWRREAIAPRTETPQATQPSSSRSSDWRRFGDPSAFRSSSGEATRNQLTTEPRSQSGGWTTPQESRGNAWRSDSSRGWGSSESIRVNPPIVRDRPAEAPRYAQPQSSAPRYEPQRSEAPRYQAPQGSSYRAPQTSSPSYSAPHNSSPSRSEAPRSSGFSGGSSGGGRSSGGGGGGHSSGGGGGGHSSGGGGSHGGGGGKR